jgi:hypothetical protein
MKATIRLDDNELVALFEDNREIKHLDAKVLADLLWAHGITADDVHAVDWRSDATIAPTSGQKIAIFSRLRKLDSALCEEQIQAGRDRTIKELLDMPIWVSRAELSLSASEQGKKADRIDLWLDQGRIFAVEYDDVQMFAKFQFDEMHSPRPVIKEILNLFKSKDAWAIASWFCYPNSWITRLQGDIHTAIPPIRALDDEDAVISAARNELGTYFA